VNASKDFLHGLCSWKTGMSCSAGFHTHHVLKALSAALEKPCQAF